MGVTVGIVIFACQMAFFFTRDDWPKKHNLAGFILTLTLAAIVAAGAGISIDAIGGGS